MSFGVTTGTTVSTVLAGDGWYPDLALAEFVELYRLPAEYAEALMADHLDLARLWAAKRLAAWRAGKEPDYPSLALVPFQGVPGGAERLYKRAVYCRAKAYLLQQFATIERRDAARNNGKEAPETAERFFAQAGQALAYVTGDTFIRVEAI